MSVQSDEIRRTVQAVGATGRPVAIHASLRSFGHVQGGGRTVVEALLAEGCTVLVPSFSQAYAVAPLPHHRPPRNASDYSPWPPSMPGDDRIYTSASNELDRGSMGAVPADVLERSDRQRGNHPLSSFSAVGPLARSLVEGQAPLDVCAPLRRLADLDGLVILMGVRLDRMTLLHLAELQAGRRMFRRWANGPAGQPIMVERGGCSSGFPRLAPALDPLLREAQVGPSRWLVYPARASLEAATVAIRAEPEITHCATPTCILCQDAIAGGPILPADGYAT
jgi:aminoglycoside 3-N-acetyltransferase